MTDVHPDVSQAGRGTSVAKASNAKSFDAFRSKQDVKSFAVGIGDHICVLIVEHQLRRELRKPVGEGVELTGHWPELNKPLGLERTTKIVDKF
jgi:hypothetical protein